MKACGIVAELNPLHNGHKYIMSEAARLTGCDAVAVAMSGNFVQRGEPAVYDKWMRAGAALRNGADLVIEIPTACVLSDAGRYAGAGVKLLESLGCVDQIAFGSESGDTRSLSTLAKIMTDHREALSELIPKYAERGMSYPAAREAAVAELLESDKYTDTDSDSISDSISDMPLDISAASDILHNPNDILGLEYISAMKIARPLPVRRRGASYGGSFDDGAEFQSASGIREVIASIRAGRAGSSDAEALGDYVPEDMLDIIRTTEPNLSEMWTDILRYAVMISSADILDNCPSGGEGLGNLLKEAVRECSSMHDIIMHCKSRRYTYTRLSRLCMQAVLGLDRSYQLEPPYIRILGFTERGRGLLSHVKKNELNSLPVITNINKERNQLSDRGLRLLVKEAECTDIYNLAGGRDIIACSEYKLTPLMST